MNNTHRSVFLAAMMLTIGALAFGQTAETHPWWITLGGGPAMTEGALTMGLGAAYSKMWESSIISGRILGVTNDNPTIWRLDPPVRTYRLTEYGILYGPAWSGLHGYVSVGAGIGLVRTKIEEGLIMTTGSGISLPLEAQAFWHVYGSFGLGLYAYSSINTSKSFSGLIIAVQLGVMDRSVK